MENFNLENVMDSENNLMECWIAGQYVTISYHPSEDGQYDDEYRKGAFYCNWSDKLTGSFCFCTGETFDVALQRAMMFLAKAVTTTEERMQKLAERSGQHPKDTSYDPDVLGWSKLDDPFVS